MTPLADRTGAVAGGQELSWSSRSRRATPAASAGGPGAGSASGTRHARGARAPCPLPSRWGYAPQPRTGRAAARRRRRGAGGTVADGRAERTAGRALIVLGGSTRCWGWCWRSPARIRRSGPGLVTVAAGRRAGRAGAAIRAGAVPPRSRPSCCSGSCCLFQLYTLCGCRRQRADAAAVTGFVLFLVARAVRARALTARHTGTPRPGPRGPGPRGPGPRDRGWGLRPWCRPVIRSDCGGDAILAAPDTATRAIRRGVRGTPPGHRGGRGRGGRPGYRRRGRPGEPRAVPDHRPAGCEPRPLPADVVARTRPGRRRTAPGGRRCRSGARARRAGPRPPESRRSRSSAPGTAARRPRHPRRNRSRRTAAGSGRRPGPGRALRRRAGVGDFNDDNRTDDGWTEGFAPPGRSRRGCWSSATCATAAAAVGRSWTAAAVTGGATSPGRSAGRCPSPGPRPGAQRIAVVDVVRGGDEPPTWAGSPTRRRPARPPIACAPNSFVPGTRVLLADGTALPHRGRGPGMLVVAADPVTGAAGARAVHPPGHRTGEGPGRRHRRRRHGHGHRRPPVLSPPTARWTAAADLRPGDTLLTPTGTWAPVTDVMRPPRPRDVHNPPSRASTLPRPRRLHPVLTQPERGCGTAARKTWRYVRRDAAAAGARRVHDTGRHVAALRHRRPRQLPRTAQLAPPWFGATRRTPRTTRCTAPRRGATQARGPHR
jgi:hypothetical protein